MCFRLNLFQPIFELLFGIFSGNILFISNLYFINNILHRILVTPSIIRLILSSTPILILNSIIFRFLKLFQLLNNILFSLFHLICSLFLGDHVGVLRRLYGSQHIVQLADYVLERGASFIFTRVRAKLPCGSWCPPKERAPTPHDERESVCSPKSKLALLEDRYSILASQ